MSTLKSSAEDLTLNADGSGNDVIIQSNGSTVATIDSNKNLILGATAKTAHASYNLIQGNNYTLTEDVTAGASKATTWCYNAYTDAGNAWTYMNADEASQIQQYNGQVTIATAGAGSAEGDITFTNKLTVANAGDVTVGVGDLIFGTAGKGICLGVTTNTDANTLDDYEEGTFTPAFKNVTVSSYTNQVGLYTKIGNRVFFQIDIDTTAMDNSDGSAVAIEGLPFTIASTTLGLPFTVVIPEGTNVPHPMMLGQNNNDYMLMWKYSASTGDTGDWAAYNVLGTTVRIYVEGHYTV